VSAEADKLSREINDADKRIAQLYAQAKSLEPQQREIVEHQIKRVEGAVRDMRIKLASLHDRSDVPCPHCKTKMPYGFQFCRPCIQDLPFKLYVRLKSAVGFHHHKLVSDSFLQDAMDAAISHLKQHSSAVL
jgi:predicted  nucleic acid-binding Zn-ribbon protein